jgi:cation/acetate symporter
MNPEAGAAIITGTPLFPLTNPAIVSIPLGFLGGLVGTLLSKEANEKKFSEVNVRANTGGFRQL